MMRVGLAIVREVENLAVTLDAELTAAGAGECRRGAAIDFNRDCSPFDRLFGGLID
jgi:hypothetical protein